MFFTKFNLYTHDNEDIVKMLFCSLSLKVKLVLHEHLTDVDFVASSMRGSPGCYDTVFPQQ